MTEYLQYAWIAAVCCLLTGGGLFVVLKRWFQDRRVRLGIVLPAMLLAFAGALLMPPVIVILRGDSLLPSWTALLLPVMLLLILPPFWRSVLNRLPQPAGGASDDVVEVAAAQGLAVASDDGADKAQSGNLLADIARAREALTELPSDTNFNAVVELLASEHRETAEIAASTIVRATYQAEPKAVPQRALRPESQMEPHAGVAPRGEPVIPLVPEPVPPGVPFLRLLDKAWEERAAARPVQAASWFLACLSRSATPAALRNEILMDLCALLKEHRFEREALELLASDIAADCEPALRQRITRELESSLRLHQT